MEQLRRFVIPRTETRWVRRGSGADAAPYSLLQKFRCDFIDTDGQCIRRDELQSPTLEAVIETCVALLPLPAFSACAGFELWRGDKLVHRHRRSRPDPAPQPPHPALG